MQDALVLRGVLDTLTRRQVGVRRHLAAAAIRQRGQVMGVSSNSDIKPIYTRDQQHPKHDQY